MNTNLLNNIKIASPCSADWNAMVGDDRKRFCGDCKLNVYNLSDMSKVDAENFLLASEGRVCVRFFKRADGTVLTQDCPVGWAKVKRKISRTATAAFGLFAGLFGGLFAFGFFKKAEVHTMGSMEVAQPKNATVGTVAEQPTNTSVIMGNFSMPIRVEKGELAVEGEISNIDEVRRQIKKHKR
jgi:hypothetical protein